MLLRLHSHVYAVALVFMGAGVIALGFLVRQSTFVPRVIGILLFIDGLGYLTATLSGLLSPAFAAHLTPPLPFATAIIGEGSLFLWLIVKGVNDERWREHATFAKDEALVV